MIATRLSGGLGNQMFEYAAARALALKHQSSLYMDLEWFGNIAEADTKRIYELNQFTLEQQFLKPGSFLLLKPRQPAVTNLLKRLKHRSKPTLKWYQEKHFEYDPTFAELPDNTYLNGYWQSYKYFADHRDTLLKDFSLVATPSKTSQDLLKKIKAEDSVSLHIRRGDYVSNQAAANFHGIIDLSYYHKAIELISKKIDDVHVYVFSDDPNWCKKNLKLKHRTTFVSHNTKGVDDMQLMTACKHNILANSSFSWWGAWLNQNSEKIVVRPKQWFSDQSINTNDLVPKEWKII